MAEAVGKAQEAGLLDGRRFAHDLVREAIVQATPEALRSVLHGSIARHCEHLIPAHRVAQHWWAAQRPAPAVAALQRACAEDRARGLHSEVATTLGRWLERVDALPLRARLHAELALTHQQADDVTGAEAQVLLALDSLPEPAARSTALCVRAELAFRQGRMQAALDAIEEAEAAAPEHFEVLSTQSRIAMAAGQPDRALGAMRQAERLLRQRPPGPELATALTAIGALLDTKGDVQGGLPLHREAWRLARRLGARYVQVEVATNMVWSMPTMNLHAEAVEIAREALALGEFDGTQTLRNNLAWLLADMGRPGDALPLYEQLADSDDPTLRCVALSQLIRVQAARGDAPGTAGAIESTLAALAATDVYLAHAAAIAAVLDHGTPEQARRALAWLRDDDLDPYLARVLQKALENHAERERLAGN